MLKKLAKGCLAALALVVLLILVAVQVMTAKPLPEVAVQLSDKPIIEQDRYFTFAAKDSTTSATSS